MWTCRSSLYEGGSNRRILYERVEDLCMEVVVIGDICMDV